MPDLSSAPLRLPPPFHHTQGDREPEMIAPAVFEERDTFTQGFRLELLLPRGEDPQQSIQALIQKANVAALLSEVERAIIILKKDQIDRVGHRQLRWHPIRPNRLARCALKQKRAAKLPTNPLRQRHPPVEV